MTLPSWETCEGNIGSALEGLFAFADAPKANAKSAVTALKQAGIEPHLLTGDNAGAAAAIGALLGISQVRAEALPVDKVAYVTALREQVYDEAAVHSLRFAHRARELALAHVATLDRKIDERTSIKVALSDLAASCHGDERPNCPILDDIGR